MKFLILFPLFIILGCTKLGKNVTVKDRIVNRITREGRIIWHNH
jgi:hypothetical protein